MFALYVNSCPTSSVARISSILPVYILYTAHPHEAALVRHSEVQFKLSLVFSFVSSTLKYCRIRLGKLNIVQTKPHTFSSLSYWPFLYSQWACHALDLLCIEYVVRSAECRSRYVMLASSSWTITPRFVRIMGVTGDDAHDAIFLLHSLLTTSLYRTCQLRSCFSACFQSTRPY